MLEEKSEQDTLPDHIPIFPLGGVLLLPGSKLPLNIFEPRYLDMIRDAMSSNRVIGMVQPMPLNPIGQPTQIYNIGGAGQITAFEETEDCRIEITLTGVSRFAIIEELAVTTRYRQVAPDWDRYAADRRDNAAATGIDRSRLLTALRAYLELAQIPADWGSISKAQTGPLISSLAMICPFEPAEKHALLEAHDLFERCRILTALLEMSLIHRTSGVKENSDNDSRKLH